MSRMFALIKAGVVVNTILWDGPDASPMVFPEGVSYVEFPGENGEIPAIGWLYEGKAFASPPLTDEEKSANEQAAIAANASLKNALMEDASGKNSVLQDAVDLNMATDEETKALPLWKKYRILLNRVEASTPEEVTWPPKPE